MSGILINPFIVLTDTTAPTITSANTDTVAENATLSHSLTADETVTWSIVSGADQSKFEISGSTLRWASNGTKDYEAPDDADTNNTYVVAVRATDLASNTTDQTITVTVTDVTTAAFVNAGSETTVTLTTFTLSRPGSRVNGNLLIACTTIASSRSPSWSAGWTPIGSGNEFAYCVVTGSETDPTVTWTGSSTQTGRILQYGIVNASPVGATNENQAQTGTTASCTAITTTANNSLCVAIIIGLTGTPTTPSGFTSDTTQTGNMALRAASVLVPTSGSSSGAVSSTVTSGIWRVCLLELKDA